MRRGNDAGFMLNGSGDLAGINLGADYCAEHEWGISGIRKAFGLSAGEDVFGIERRRVASLPGLDFGLVDDGTVLAYYHRWDHGASLHDQIKGTIDRELCLHGKSLATAWNGGDHGGNGFAVRVADKVGKRHLRDVYDAFAAKDAAIWLGGGGVFRNAGLVLAIISRLPKDKLAEMEEADRDVARLKTVAATTGIETELQAAGRRWFALSPRWADDKKQSVVFWLNPMEQDINNSGWFTVEQLQEWAKGKGPVMKSRRERRR